MPAKSQAQQAFMGAELARKRAGEATETDMSEQQLKEFAATKRSNLPKRKTIGRPDKTAELKAEMQRREKKEKPSDEKKESASY